MSFSSLSKMPIGTMATMAVLGGVIWPTTAVWSAEGDAPKRPYVVLAQQQPDRSEGPDDPREKGKARGDRDRPRDEQERPRGGGQDRQRGDPDKARTEQEPQSKARAEQERRRGDQDKARADQERQRGDQDKARAEQERQRGDQGKGRADQERQWGDQGKGRAEQERQRGDQGKGRADQERQRGDQDKARAEQERQRGDQGKGRAEQERQRGDQDKARADQERQRGDQDKARADRERQRGDQDKGRAEQERQRGDQDKGRAEQERQRGDQDKGRAEQERERGDQDKGRAVQGDRRRDGGVREKAAQEQLQRERDRLGRERDRYQSERGRFEQERRRDRPGDKPSSDRERELREQDRRLKAAEERLKFRDADQRRWRDRVRTQDSALQGIDDVKRNRRERVEDGRTIIEESDQRVIVRDGGRSIIRHNEVERYRRLGLEVQSQKRNNGVLVSIVRRPGGIEIITEHSPEGLLLRRYRRERGREISLIDNRRHYARGDGRRWRQDDARFTVAEVRVPRVEIPTDKYIVEYGAASDDDLYEAFISPPIERLTRTYSLDEVRYTQPIRAHMRRVDLDEITFDFGSWELDGEAYRKLERLARAIQRVLDERTEEVFLIEGHTDAVGSDVDNLSLSDRRAESVAIALTETFGIPPENLTTQGYGEQFLKVSTEDAERANRRVAVRRITPLISQRSSGLGSDR